jgi:large subunit ribosomal protein L32e
MVKIGYGTNADHRHLLQNGFRKFTVHNASELNMLLMNNGKLAAEIAKGVSIKTRKEIVARAHQLDIKVLNEKARLRTEESE